MIGNPRNEARSGRRGDPCFVLAPAELVETLGVGEEGGYDQLDNMGVDLHDPGKIPRCHIGEESRLFVILIALSRQTCSQVSQPMHFVEVDRDGRLAERAEAPR